MTIAAKKAQRIGLLSGASKRNPKGTIVAAYPIPPQMPLSTGGCPRTSSDEIPGSELSAQDYCPLRCHAPAAALRLPL
jgi:hypothetical protein